MHDEKQLTLHFIYCFNSAAMNLSASYSLIYQPKSTVIIHDQQYSDEVFSFNKLISILLKVRAQGLVCDRLYLTPLAQICEKWISTSHGDTEMFM